MLDASKKNQNKLAQMLVWWWITIVESVQKHLKQTEGHGANHPDGWWIGCWHFVKPFPSQQQYIGLLQLSYSNKQNSIQNLACIFCCCTNVLLADTNLLTNLIISPLGIWSFHIFTRKNLANYFTNLDFIEIIKAPCPFPGTLPFGGKSGRTLWSTTLPQALRGITTLGFCRSSWQLGSRSW